MVKRPNIQRKTKQQYEDMTLEELSYLMVVKGKNDTRAVYNQVLALNRAWNATLTSDPLTARCQHCSYDKHVELAHLKAVASFPKETKLKDINHPDNVLVLCRNCHYEYDNHLLLLEDIPLRTNH